VVEDERSLEPKGSRLVVLELGSKDLLLIPAGKEASFFCDVEGEVAERYRGYVGEEGAREVGRFG
jgi:hypothetical protein